MSQQAEQPVTEKIASRTMARGVKGDDQRKQLFATQPFTAVCDLDHSGEKIVTRMPTTHFKQLGSISGEALRGLERAIDLPFWDLDAQQRRDCFAPLGQPVAIRERNTQHL